MKTKSAPFRSAAEHLRTMVSGRLMPILNCFLLEAKNNKLTITATDLDQRESVIVDCDGDLAAVCVNALHLTCCIGNEKEVKLKRDGSFIEITSGKCISRLPVLSAEEFQAEPESKGMTKQGISCPDLAEGIRSVVWCAHTDETRSVLVSVHVLAKAKMLLCESSDGCNLAHFERPMICPELEMLIPAEFSSRLAYALSCDGAELMVDDKSVVVVHNTGKYRCKQVDEKYPNTLPMRQYKLAEIGELNLPKVVAALDSCSALIDRSKTPSGMVSFSKDGIGIKFSTVNGEQNSTVEGKFKAHSARVNIEVMRKCLKAIKSDTCKVFCGEKENAGLFLSYRSGDLGVLSMNLRSE